MASSTFPHTLHSQNELRHQQLILIFLFRIPFLCDSRLESFLEHVPILSRTEDIVLSLHSFILTDLVTLYSQHLQPLLLFMSTTVVRNEALEIL